MGHWRGCWVPEPAPDPAGVPIVLDPGLEVVEVRAVELDGRPVELVEVTRAGPPADPFAPACALGDLDACHAQGSALLGAGLAAQAAAVWLAACERGHAAACGDLAYQYDNPYVADRDGQALAVATRACDLRAQPISCYLLARWHEEGRLGAPKDPAEAAGRHRPKQPTVQGRRRAVSYQHSAVSKMVFAGHSESGRHPDCVSAASAVRFSVSNFVPRS
ncbi:MAG: hypothetical protein ABIO70_20850 [Pseudomonadota bacterium]